MAAKSAIASRSPGRSPLGFGFLALRRSDARGGVAERIAPLDPVNGSDFCMVSRATACYESKCRVAIQPVRYWNLTLDDIRRSMHRWWVLWMQGLGLCLQTVSRGAWDHRLCSAHVRRR